MSVSSPEVSLSSSSTSSSKDDVDYWEVNPPPPPTALSRLNSMDCWDYSIELDCLKGPEDLQLAAELGKTLLERNKELEGSIKHQQSVIDDQLQEIEYLTKQNNALREVNDTRLKIYENIEISIQDLEKQNHRLNVDSSNLKKINKNLTTTNETLEEKCEDLRKQIEELHREVEIERRKNERLQQEQRTKKDELVTSPVNYSSREPFSNSVSTSHIETEPIRATANDILEMGVDEVDRRLAETCDNDEIMNIITELDGTKRQLIAERQRVSELEDQLSSLIQDNRELQNRVAQSVASEVGEMRSMHDELAILEESGQKMCRRCLRSFDDETLMVPDYASSIACTEDGDDASLNELLTRTSSVQSIYQTGNTTNQEASSADSTLNLSAPSPNPYRELVNKYEKLVEVHNNAFNRNRQEATTPVSSLHDELASCNFMPINNTATESSQPSSENAVASSGAKRKLTMQTPTDFSEAETSSSGYSDEIISKCTQTEETFLCSIADGEDKFSIYDEADNPTIDSRFRHCPKYRHLFKEIFATLKKAAENKDEGEKLPLLDDATPALKVPPVTPAAEELPSFPEVETESVVSSVMSEQSMAMSECVTKHERKTAKKKTNQENKSPTKKELFESHSTTPNKREPLEYLAFNNLRKKNKKRNRQGAIDPSDSPAMIPTSPRFFYANRKRRERVAYEFSKDAPSGSGADAAKRANTDVVWNGNSITVYNRNMQSKTNAAGEKIVYRTKSAAAHDLHKLMKLDLSYAEVLRQADQTNKHHYKRK